MWKVLLACMAGLTAVSCGGPTETTSLANITAPLATIGTSVGASGARTIGGTGLAGLLDGITSLTGKWLYDRMQSAPSENIIMSAMSLFSQIAMFCIYSTGPAYDQCIKILNLQDKNDIRGTFPTLDSSFEDESSNYSVTGVLIIKRQDVLLNLFLRDAANFYDEVVEVDFSENGDAQVKINAYVARKTNNRITNSVQADMFSALTRLVLVNPIYFQDKWLYAFNKNNTKEEDFYMNDGTTKKTQLMYQEIKDLEYGEIPSLDCKAVRVFYQSKNRSMIFVLPNTYNGTMELAKNLQNTDNWKKVTDSLAPERVQLYIPSFEIGTTTNFKDLLIKAGIINWFDCNNSGLTGLLANPNNFCISDAIQPAWIKVDEEGSEAAAPSGIIGGLTPGLPPPKEFRADHSFLYFLRVQSVTVLCGVYHN